MKILFISDSIYPYHKGGKETRIYEITKRLANMGHDVHIFSFNWWQGKKVIKQNQVTLHGICPLKDIYTSKGIRSIWSAIYFALKLFWPLVKSNYDYYEVDHMPFFPLYTARLATWLKGKKLYATWHEVWGKKYWQSYMGKFQGLIACYIEKLAVRLPSKVISVSEFTSQRLQTFFKVKPDKITIIHNGIDYDLIDQAKSHNEPSDLIFIGRLLSHKNVNVLIDTVSELKKSKPDISCVIIGQGPEHDKLKAQSSKLKLETNIKLLKNLDRAKTLARLRASKIFILPSTREGYGITVLEANAAGLPVIVIDHPDNAAKQLIKSGQNGFICQLEPKIIAQNINKLLNQSDLYQQMSEQAKISAQNHDWDQEVAKYATLLT